MINNKVGYNQFIMDGLERGNKTGIDINKAVDSRDFIACRVQVPIGTSEKLLPLLLGTTNYEIKVGERSVENDQRKEDNLDRWMRDCVASNTTKRNMVVSASRDAIRNVFEKINRYEKAVGKTQEEQDETSRLKLELIRRQEEALKGVNKDEPKASVGFGPSSISGWLKSKGEKGSRDGLG